MDIPGELVVAPIPGSLLYVQGCYSMVVGQT